MGSNGPFMGRAMMSAEAAPVCFFLASSFRHTFTRHRRQQMKTFKIYRYDPDSNKEPELQEYKLDLNEYVLNLLLFMNLNFTLTHAPQFIKNWTHGTGCVDQN